LVLYCEQDNIDQAILLILNYKLNNNSNKCEELCNYIYQNNAGWSQFNDAAIHHVIRKIKPTSWSYENNDKIKTKYPTIDVPENDKDIEKKKKIEINNKNNEKLKKNYILQIIKNKYNKTLLLFEILCRENASMTLKSHASGWRVDGKKMKQYLI